MHEIIESKGKPIKAWIAGVPVEAEARAQLRIDGMKRLTPGST